MGVKIDRIDSAVKRIEHEETGNVMVMLKQIDGKLTVRDSEVQALNKRVFKTEAEIERFAKQ